MKIWVYIFVIALFFSMHVFAQTINIVPALKKVEAGEIEAARRMLKELKQENPKNPDVLFLDAVLTDNGEDALFKYEMVYRNHPKSKYADASVFRIFSYYYALGIYKKAETYKQKLIKKYPRSPYVKAVNRKIPDIEFENISPTTAQNTTPVPSAQTRFTVQAGAFLNIDNAKSLVAKISEKGYKAAITPKDIGGSILNVVTAGKFSTKDEAEKFLIWLNDKFELNGRIKTINN